MPQRRFLKRTKRIRLKEKRIMQRTVFVAVSLFSLFGLVIWGAHNQNIRIKNIYVEENNVVSGKNIQEQILADINGKYLWLLPKDNILTYPKKQIKKDILFTFKRISYIKINIINPTSIVVTVKERDPYALWCGENLTDIKREVLNDCFFIDNTGFVFAKAPNFSNDIYFTVYGTIKKTSFSQSPADSSIGKRFLEERYFKSLMLFRESLLSEGINVNYVALQDSNDIELYITTGGKIIFSKKQDIEKIFRDLISSVKAKEVGGTDVWKNLEYIDLRFGNRVLFKFTS